MCERNHTHCHNFCPVDVAKGICRLSGNIIMTDNPVCERFSEKPRCEHCSHYCDETSPARCLGLGKPYWVDATTDIKVVLRLAGPLIGPNETAIAGYAIAVGAILVTNNVGEFEQVSGLKLEGWVN